MVPARPGAIAFDGRADDGGDSAFKGHECDITPRPRTFSPASDPVRQMEGSGSCCRNSRKPAGIVGMSPPATTRPSRACINEHAALAVLLQSHVRFHRAALLWRSGRNATP